MGTTKEMLSAWFDDGVRVGATHMVVVCDTFSYEDYPVYVMPEHDVREVVQKRGAGPKGRSENNEMSKVMEVYAMHRSKREQLDQHRAFCLEDPPVKEEG